MSDIFIKVGDNKYYINSKTKTVHQITGPNQFFGIATFEQLEHDNVHRSLSEYKIAYDKFKKLKAFA